MAIDQRQHGVVVERLDKFLGKLFRRQAFGIVPFPVLDEHGVGNFSSGSIVMVLDKPVGAETGLVVWFSGLDVYYFSGTSPPSTSSTGISDS